VIWAEVKSALNSTVGNRMKPLDEIIKEAEYDSYYYGAVLDAERETKDYSVESGGLPLKVAVIPYGLKNTNDFYFGNGNGVRHVFLPSTLESIGYGFGNQIGGITHLKNLRLPPRLKFIGERAFNGAEELESLVIPRTVNSIGEQAFGYTSLRTVVFEGKPSSISARAFSGSHSITDIYVPWSEGEVGDMQGEPDEDPAPWGAVNATVHYNHIL